MPPFLSYKELLAAAFACMQGQEWRMLLPFGTQGSSPPRALDAGQGMFGGVGGPVWGGRQLSWLCLVPVLG